MYPHSVQHQTSKHSRFVRADICKLHYLQHQNNNIGVLVFATDTDLQHLANATIVFFDGTFRTAPKPYKQFFTIHGEVNGHVLKMTRGLLLNKDMQSYEEVFRAIRNRIRILTGQPWVVREMVMDYETAVMNAAVNVFPGVDIRGCYFQFNKAIYQILQQLGLGRTYERDQSLRRLIRKDSCR